MKKKVLVFVGSRANYSSIKSVMMAIRAHNDLDLQVVVAASAVLDRFGNVSALIEQDGFKIDRRYNNLVEGENPSVMARSTGLGVIDCAAAFEELKPDCVVIVGDRFEMMAPTLAAAYMNIQIAHTMGGEVTGTIDESIRHAITKFAHLHFTANSDAAKRVEKLGEDTASIFNVGCPRIDLVAKQLSSNFGKELNRIFDTYEGVGDHLDLSKGFLLVSQHPVTTEFENTRSQMNETLDALDRLRLPTILLWPNADAGGDSISKAIRTFREKRDPKWLHVFKNLPTNVYIELMDATSCLVGNSSSGIREGAFIGTPVVNVGSRQTRRMRGANVLSVDSESSQIEEAIRHQMNKGKYNRDFTYGDGSAGEQIANAIASTSRSIQKVISY